MGRHERDGLGHVEGRSAAQADDPVRPVCAIGGHARGDRAFDGVARDVGEEGGIPSGGAQLLDQAHQEIIDEFKANCDVVVAGIGD